MSKLVDITEAVKDELNAGVFSESFTATRQFLLVRELSANETLRVDVVPARKIKEGSTRAADFSDYRVGVAIRKKLTGAASTDDAALVDLLDLAEEIENAFFHKRLANYNEAACVGVVTETPLQFEDLDRLRQFTATIELIFRA